MGGDQKRPNVHIEDMCRFYLEALQWEDQQIDGRIYNVGEKNHTVNELAEMVRTTVGSTLGKEVGVDVLPTNDPRSYHVSSNKIMEELGFVPQHTICEAVEDLVAAFAAGKLTDPMTNPLYFNIKRMQELHLQ
jgi:nucleoside-diphosphate-sugar epimerase